MKLIHTLIGAAVLSGLLTVAVLATEHGSGDSKSANPYPLKTCVVSGEKLGGDMGKPYVFVEQGQEVKLCCKGCLKDFKKEPAKYLKKIADAKKGATEDSAETSSHDHSQHHH